jgi:hypothetical protein
VARTAHSPSSSGGTSHNSRPLCRNVDESQSCAKSPTAVSTSPAGRRDHRRLLVCQAQQPISAMS